MKSWYKKAQQARKKRQFEFDNAENVFYKVIEREEPFEEDDIIRVYHAFRDMNDAIMTAQYGLSGQTRASRVYSYESNNNPSGLFVTTNFETAKQFTSQGAIMEFDCKYSELDIPVWPGGGYTVQGQMSKSWEWDKLDEQRQEAILQQREQAKQSEYSAVVNSSRPELAEMLMSPSEYQALFVGNLNPTRINSFWVQEQQGEQPLMTDPWVELSREEFIKNHQYEMSKGFNGVKRMPDQHVNIERKVFLPEDEFDATTFVQKLSETLSTSPKELMDTLKEWSPKELMDYLSREVWPKQRNGLEQWIQIINQ